MPQPLPLKRCRLVLILPAARGGGVASLRAALSGGDVASVILSAGGMGEADFQDFAEAAVPLAQDAGAAALIADDTRIAGRVKADGVHLETGAKDLADAIAAHRPRMIVGAGGAKTRDEALMLGEAQPDYMFFGRAGYDTKPEPHARNLKLGQWWAEMVAIPSIVLGGSEIQSAVTAAKTGADFVALSQAIFGEGVDPEQAVAQANALLDEHAPVFETA